MILAFGQLSTRTGQLRIKSGLVSINYPLCVILLHAYLSQKMQVTANLDDTHALGRVCRSSTVRNTSARSLSTNPSSKKHPACRHVPVRQGHYFSNFWISTVLRYALCYRNWWSVHHPTQWKHPKRNLPIVSRKHIRRTLLLTQKCGPCFAQTLRRKQQSPRRFISRL